MDVVALAREREVAGREREITALSREYDEARTRGQVRLAFVKGPAGIGKTHLFRALRRSLTDHGGRVFEGGAPRHDRRAYGLFAPMVTDLLGFAAELGIPQRTLVDLTRRLAPVIGHSGLLQAPAHERRVDLFDAVAELFGVVAKQTPVLLFPDADAADAASLDLLRFLVAALTIPGTAATAFLVVSFRDDGTLPAVFSDLVARAPALSVPLAGLDLEGIRSYLSRREVAERLLDATGGVPTALEQVIGAGALPNAGLLRPADLVLKRLASLPTVEADVMRALAVAGMAAGDQVASLIVAVRGAAPTDLAQRLDGLEKSHLLEVVTEPYTHAAGKLCYAFARPADREAVLAALTPTDRSVLELASGEVREASGDLEAAAAHFLHADPRGRGVVAAQAAAQTLADRCAFGEAASLLRQALAHAPAADQGGLHLRLSEVLTSSAEFVQAMRHLGYARRALPALRRELRARAAGVCALMGRHRLGIRLCHSVLGGNQRPTDPAGEKAFAHLVDLTAAQGDYEAAEALARSGLGWFGDRFDLATELRNALGKTLLARGRYDEARTAFEDNLASACGANNRGEEARAVINLGVVAHRRGDRRAAIAHYRAALDGGALDRTLQAMALANLGSLFADSGEFGRAVESLTRAVATFTRIRRQDATARFALNLASLHLFLGEFERASELVEHARSVAEDNHDAYHVASAILVRGEIAEARGDWAEALPHLGDARDRFEILKSPRYAAEATLNLARVHLARGELALARLSLARPAVDDMAATIPAIAVERDLLAGEIALVGGDLGEASRRLVRAKDLLFENPDLEGPFRVHFLLSKLRLAANDSAGAEAEVTRAARLVDELASRVPVASRAAFLRSPRRAQVLAAAERGITPAHVATALDLDTGREPSSTQPIVGGAPSLQKVLKVLDAVARSPATVLIRGESGTGKELIADAIHRKSARRDKPFIKVNCAAMVEELLLSELFGHEKGAFTGAVRERRGRFELADTGSIFLDEIGDISPKCQVALLRVLQEREFERVGGQKTIRIDVRVMCATNRNLEEMVERGAFREDLYYRLRGVMLELPPLRDRLEDLPALCNFLLAKVARERNEPQKVLSPAATELLRSYPWPGNIRELENMIAATTIFATGTEVGPEAFEHIREFQAKAIPLRAVPTASAAVNPAATQTPPANGVVDYFEVARGRGLSLKDLRREVENQCIERALAEAGGNISEAARLLQMKRSRLSQIINADPHLRSVAKGDDGKQEPEMT
jgi:transcriptional regulator with GAF, ATPase, and Fis domain/tetratricopeptide (TPR) repeat protein